MCVCTDIVCVCTDIVCVCARVRSLGKRLVTSVALLGFDRVHARDKERGQDKERKTLSRVQEREHMCTGVCDTGLSARKRVHVCVLCLSLFVSHE